ncbi:MAG TPA: hypothetical protein DIC30_06020 [Oceanospirillales bacterium]|nr:hypothetical protein [Oleispira sp.]HCM05550.1 hypothetical protein [Oceanospirillales bacterium]|tara:strand:+ start:1339 stop:1560 length:222 start_codon:yes stop_codon:yes gene_type:complete
MSVILVTGQWKYHPERINHFVCILVYTTLRREEKHKGNGAIYGLAKTKKAADIQRIKAALKGRCYFSHRLTKT